MVFFCNSVGENTAFQNSQNLSLVDFSLLGLVLYFNPFPPRPVKTGPLLFYQ